MKNKNFLSLQDLYDFYVKQNKDITFSSKEADDRDIVVHMEIPMNFSIKKFDSEENLISKLRFCHTLDNVNKTFISKKSMEKAMPSLYNKPILAYIYENDEGEFVFAGHEFYEDENGETVYEEHPVGTVPESANLELVFDKKEKKDYLEGYGIIWRTYSKAAEILEREEKCSVSVELDVKELSYSAKDKILNIDEFVFDGVTILGEDRETGREIKPGMRGAEITIANFSAEENSIFNKELLEEIKKFNMNFEKMENKQGGQYKMNLELFQELLSQYNVTEEDIQFEYSELDDEALKSAFAEAFAETAETSDNGDSADASAESDNTSDESADTNDGDNANDDDVDNSDDNSDDDSSDDDSSDANVDNGDDTSDNAQTYSITLPNGQVKTFSLSLNEIQNALYCLVNDTYADLDNDIYSVVVYEDDKEVVMIPYFGSKIYKQSYRRKKDNFSLEGDRVQVYAAYLTEDEQKRLEDMKANYASIDTELKDCKAKLANYEAEPEKIALLESDDFAGIKATEEYAELSKRENYFELDKADLEEKLNGILLQYAKSNKLNFSANEEIENKNDNKPENKFSMRPLPTFTTTKNRGRYGNLFSSDK